jgi:hypothetical protein
MIEIHELIDINREIYEGYLGKTRAEKLADKVSKIAKPDLANEALTKANPFFAACESLNADDLINGFTDVTDFVCMLSDEDTHIAADFIYRNMLENLLIAILKNSD